MIDVTKPFPTDDSKASPKGQATASSGEPSAAAGFHNRPATRAGPYDDFFSFAFAFSVEQNFSKVFHRFFFF